MTKLSERFDELCICDGCRTKLLELQIETIKLQTKQIERETKLAPLNRILDFSMWALAIAILILVKG